jgi:hypothetical protein
MNKDLAKVLGVIAAIVAIKRIANSRRACICVGPFCVCGYR